MFCRECGKMIQEGNKFCTGCGTKVQPISIKVNTEKINNGPIVEENKQVENPVNKVNSNNNNYNQNNTNVVKVKDKASVGFNVLAFFVPIVGLILFLVWKNETPKKAKAIGISALVGYILSIIVPIILAIIMFGISISSEVIVNDYDDKWKNDDYYYEDYDFDYDYDFNGKYNI